MLFAVLRAEGIHGHAYTSLKGFKIRSGLYREDDKLLAPPPVFTRHVRSLTFADDPTLFRSS